MEQHKNVIFLDWNKTLSNSLFWSQLTDVNHPYNPHHPTIVEWLFVQNTELIPEWMRGKISAEDICTRLSEHTGILTETIFNELVLSCRNMEFCDSRVPDLVQRIRATGRKVVIATDNMDTFTRFTVPAMNLDALFDGILNSFDLGVLKEDVQGDNLLFFESFTKDHKLDYSQVILLDDSQDNTGTYERVGFDRTLITGSHHLISELEKYTI